LFPDTKVVHIDVDNEKMKLTDSMVQGEMHQLFG